MTAEKRIVQILVLLIVGVMTVYTLLLRSAMYNEDGFVRTDNAALRIVGEDAAGDYALFRLLESAPEKAYDFKAQTAYVHEKTQAAGQFAAFASPVKAFVAVPFLPLPYTGYFDTVFFWGFFLFGVALYALFPLRVAVPLLAAFPAAFVNFAFGGFGLYAAACAVLSLTLSDEYPKRAGFFGGLLAAEPLMFALVLFAFAVEKRKKAFAALRTTPCRFVSLAGALLCNGAGAFAVWTFQVLTAVWVVLTGWRLFFKSPLAPLAVKNAFLCAAGVLLNPVATAGDGALLSAAVAFLLFDSERRGYLKADLPLFVLAFGAIFFDGMLAAAVGMSAQTAVAVLLPLACGRRAY